VDDIHIVLRVDLKRIFLEQGNRVKQEDDRYVQYNGINNAYYTYILLSHPLKQLIDGVLSWRRSR
jgi:hypothetical protein